jgi:hypothetical protein
MRTALLTSALMAFVAHPASQRNHLFAPAAGSPIQVGPGSGTIVFGDIDRDGHLDMLTRHLLTRRAMVLRGDGRGGFAPSGSIAFDYEPGDMALGDLDKDGIPDLAVTPGRQDVVDIYLGTGKGTFSKTAASPITVSPEVEPFNKRTLRLADLNEDGNLDIVTANGRRKTTMGVLFGDGRGGFTAGPPIGLHSGGDGYVFALADLNRDGHLDAVSISRQGYGEGGPGKMSVQLGVGRGVFKAAPESAFPVPAGPRALTVADVDGDGLQDVLIGHDRGDLSVFLNRDGQTFAHAEGSPFDIDLQTHAMRAVDVDGDRRVDLVAATVSSITVLLGNGRRFAPAAGSPFKAGPGAYNLTLGDVNEDGKLDVAASSFEGDGVTLLLRR